MIVQIIQEEKVVFSGHPGDAKEHIQNMFRDKYDMEPDLCESEPEELTEGFELYLHTEAYDALTEEQILLLDQFDVTEEAETTTPAIERLFNISFHVVD